MGVLLNTNSSTFISIDSNFSMCVARINCCLLASIGPTMFSLDAADITSRNIIRKNIRSHVLIETPRIPHTHPKIGEKCVCRVTPFLLSFKSEGE